MFIINCKNYDEIAGDKIIKIAKISEKVSRKYKVPIAIAPPHLSLIHISEPTRPY